MTELTVLDARRDVYKPRFELKSRIKPHRCLIALLMGLSRGTKLSLRHEAPFSYAQASRIRTMMP